MLWDKILKIPTLKWVRVNWVLVVVMISGISLEMCLISSYLEILGDIHSNGFFIYSMCMWLSLSSLCWKYECGSIHFSMLSGVDSPFLRQLINPRWCPAHDYPNPTMGCPKWQPWPSVHISSLSESSNIHVALNITLIDDCTYTCVRYPLMSWSSWRD